MNFCAYLIENISEYGKLLSFCIENDISVFRSYWDDREKGDRCYVIDFSDRRLYYSSFSFYKSQGYTIYIPYFVLNPYSEFYQFDPCRQICLFAPKEVE